ncbi:MAG: DUF4325 domain-containing protein [Candidatus Magasanikbacteria bacterium]|nr:DUF4325 domain-containing protein [Candidatus Magasanikbacteria bacterium]
MRLELKKFGLNLTSRPAGKEAYLAAEAYTFPKDKTELIEIDFSGVQVLTPSWADEFITPLMAARPGKVVLLSTNNASVKAALEVVLEK